MKRNKYVKWISLVVLFFAILLPRISDLDQYVTTDETLWLNRSGNFYYALGQGEFEHTFQHIHPGVSIMWAGAAGFWVEYREYRVLEHGYFDEAVDFHNYLEKKGKDPLQILVSGKSFLVLGTTSVLIAAYLIAVKLIGEIPALIGFSMIAFDPFLIAVNKILNPDSFLPGLMLLASIAFMAFLEDKRRIGYLVIAAVTTGAAWITKSLGLFLIPYICLLALIDLLEKKDRPEVSLGKTISTLIIGFLIAIAAFFVFWPATWVNPIETISSILDAFRFGYGEAFPTVFFNGQITSTQDLPFTYYLILYIWRTTPIVVIGLLLALLGLIFKWGILKECRYRKYVVLLLLFPIFYLPIVSLGSIKIDRYIISVFPFFDLVAGFGWISVVSILLNWLIKKVTSTITTYIKVFGVMIAFYVMILPTISIHPYYFAYYNPLLGGAEKAVEFLTIGYGEGLDAAAAYLENKQDNITAFAYYGIGPFSYYYSGEVENMLLHTSWQDSNAKKLKNSDYVVTYINQWQRGRTAELTDALDKIKPEYTVIINEVEYAKIYKISEILPEDYQNLIQR